MSIDTPIHEFLDAVAELLPAQIAELERLRSENEHLKVALASRATIEQAKGIVMAEQRCTPDEAFQVLVRLSTRTNASVRDAAAALVDSTQATT